MPLPNKTKRPSPLGRRHRPVKSLAKALRILDALGDRPGGLGITDLSAALGAPKSTVHRLVATLESCGYVVFDPPTARYVLGSRLAKLGEQLSYQSPLLTFGVATLEELTNKCKEASHLAILEGTEVVYVSREESKDPVRISFGMGHRAPAHCTALGKALLAGLTDAEIRMLYKNSRRLDRLTPHTRTSLDDLVKELAAIRREGIACDNEEYMAGLRCIAAPVRDFSSRIVAAMSLSMFKHKMTADRRAKFKAALLQAGYELSQKLGFADPRKPAA
jgi:IclR family transcriptional regulator, KDG regulon repressor